MADPFAYFAWFFVNLMHNLPSQQREELLPAH
jgi:hypothetical protein